MFLKGLPDRNAVVLSIEDMDELADSFVIRVFINNDNVFLAQLLHYCLDIGKTVVDHQLLVFIANVIGSFREETLDGTGHKAVLVLGLCRFFYNLIPFFRFLGLFHELLMVTSTV